MLRASSTKFPRSILFHSFTAATSLVKPVDSLEQASVTVKWSWKGRVLATLLTIVPLSVWLGMADTSQSLVSKAIVAFIAGFGCLMLQLHMIRFRVDAGPMGLSETRFWRKRHVAWNDIRQVECTAQAWQSGRIYRWPSSPEEAFHIVVHTRDGRISVNRWMTDLDAFARVLRVARSTGPYREIAVSAIERIDPSVRRVTLPTEAHPLVNHLYDMVVVVFGALAFGLAGPIATASMGFGVVTSVVGAALMSLVPWGLGFLIYKAIVRVRRRRFGAEFERPHESVASRVLLLAALVGGTLLLVGFIPRVVASTREGMDFGLTLFGLLLCWIPIRRVYQSLTQL